jgi:peptide/nickel transport system substrate-binding protein
MLDGSMTPLIADGDPVCADDKSSVTVKINQAAHWSDGTPITAEDVAYTFEANVKYANAQEPNSHRTLNRSRPLTRVQW